MIQPCFELPASSQCVSVQSCVYYLCPCVSLAACRHVLAVCGAVVTRPVGVPLCHRHLAADWLLFIPDVDFIDFLSFSPSLQFQLQNFDIVCSTSWANRDKCCELPSLVRSKSEAGSMFACLKQEEMTWKLLSAHLHTVY